MTKEECLKIIKANDSLKRIKNKLKDAEAWSFSMLVDGQTLNGANIILTDGNDILATISRANIKLNADIFGREFGAFKYEIALGFSKKRCEMEYFDNFSSYKSMTERILGMYLIKIDNHL